MGTISEKLRGNKAEIMPFGVADAALRLLDAVLKYPL